MLFLSLIISFFIAILTGLGVGGGGLFVIYLALFTDTPQLAAQGINLFFFLFSAGSSVIVHLTQRKIYLSAVVIMASAGIIGAIVGAFVSGYVDQALLRKIFGAMLMISGIISLKKSFKEKIPNKKAIEENNF